MYTMKQACELTKLSYETLKFYCNEGLVPNVNVIRTIIESLMIEISHGSTVSTA